MMDSRDVANGIWLIERKVFDHRRSILKFTLICIVSFLFTSYLHDLPFVKNEQALMGGIFIFAALLWITETLPLFATSLLIIGLEIVLLANPGNWPGLGFESGLNPNYSQIIAYAADPVLMLFLGGFLLAAASSKEGVDKKLAALILKFFGTKPSNLLLGLMLVTGFFSMWMSNTATTAMMITLVIPLLSKIPKASKFGKALVLSIPFAANIGGMGTPIGSPPNAVALSLFEKNGILFGFMDWMLIALPFVVFLLLICWILLLIIYPSQDQDLHLSIDSPPMDLRGWYVIVVFGLTIFLWLSGGWHGLPSAVVALVPTVAFTATGLLKRDDVNSLEWDILLLIGGGISLGAGMKLTGLDVFLTSYIPGGSLAVVAFAFSTVILSIFMSNTATANLILPIALSFANTADMALGLNALSIGLVIAFSASCGMALPISTPPNAIAYSVGWVNTKDMLKPGVIIGFIGVVTVLLFTSHLLSFMGF